MRLDEFYSPENDRETMRRQNDSRKPKLTLAILNKMKRVREIRQAEDIEYRKLVRVMYAPPAADAEPGGMF